MNRTRFAWVGGVAVLLVCAIALPGSAIARTKRTWITVHRVAHVLVLANVRGISLYVSTGDKNGRSNCPGNPNIGTQSTSAASGTADGTGNVTSLQVNALTHSILSGTTFQIAGDTNSPPSMFTTTAFAPVGAVTLSVLVSPPVFTTIAPGQIEPLFCMQNWEPLRAIGKVTAAKGVNPKLLGTIRRSDGTRQVTYKRKPLYLFISNRYAPQAPGTFDGEACDSFGNVDPDHTRPHWWLATPRGGTDKSAASLCQQGY